MCVNRNPAPYGFRADSKAFLYGVNITLNALMPAQGKKNQAEFFCLPEQRDHSAVLICLSEGDCCLWWPEEDVPTWQMSTALDKNQLDLGWAATQSPTNIRN